MNSFKGEFSSFCKFQFIDFRYLQCTFQTLHQLYISTWVCLQCLFIFSDLVFEILLRFCFLLLLRFLVFLGSLCWIIFKKIFHLFNLNVGCNSSCSIGTLWCCCCGCCWRLVLMWWVASRLWTDGRLQFAWHVLTNERAILSELSSSEIMYEIISLQSVNCVVKTGGGDGDDDCKSCLPIRGFVVFYCFLFCVFFFSSRTDEECFFLNILAFLAQVFNELHHYITTLYSLGVL